MNMNPSIKLVTILDTIIFKNYILTGKLIFQDKHIFYILIHMLGTL